MSNNNGDEMPCVSNQNQSTRDPDNSRNINTTSFSVRNDTLHQSMEWPRNAESAYDQSMYSRKRTSSMTLSNDSGIHSLSSHHSKYTDGMGTQPSTSNGRSGSSMSVQPIESNLSAIDIAKALETCEFNKYDMKVIQKAYNKLPNKKKSKANAKKFLKGYRRVSGGESGDLASNSSLSSDDDRPRERATYNYNAGSLSTMNVSNLNNTMKESMLSVPVCRTQENLQHRLNNTSLMSKNDRHVFPLPSQTFNANQPDASLPITEMPNEVTKTRQMTIGIQNNNHNKFNQKSVHTRVHSQEPISEEEEEICSKVSGTKSQHLDHLEEENITYLDKNKLITSSFVDSNTLKPKQTTSKSDNKGNGSDFINAKPLLQAQKHASVENLKLKSEQIPNRNPKTLKTCDTIPSEINIPQFNLNSQQEETFISKSQVSMEEILPQNQTNELTNVRAMKASVSKHKKNQSQIPRRQAVAANTCVATNSISHTVQSTSNKLLDSTLNKGTAMQKTADKEKKTIGYTTHTKLAPTSTKVNASMKDEKKIKKENNEKSVPKNKTRP